MPEVIYYAALSLDGFIATESGGVEWLDRFQGKGEDYGFAEHYASVDGLLMGSHTYEFALAHPPWMATDKPSWVFTRRRLPVMDPSITLTDEDPAAVISDLGERGHRRLWLMGGGELATSFRKAGLITHYALCLVPVVLGQGIRLLAESPGLDWLEPGSVEPYDNGLVMLTYNVSRD